MNAPKKVIIVNTGTVTGPDFSKLVEILEKDGYAVTLVYGELEAPVPDARVIDMQKVIERFKPPAPKAARTISTNVPYYRSFPRRRR